MFEVSLHNRCDSAYEIGLHRRIRQFRSLSLEPFDVRFFFLGLESLGVVRSVIVARIVRTFSTSLLDFLVSSKSSSVVARAFLKLSERTRSQSMVNPISLTHLFLISSCSSTIDFFPLLLNDTGEQFACLSFVTHFTGRSISSSPLFIASASAY